MSPNNESVFELRLNEEGITRLKQTLSLTRWLMIIGFAEIAVFSADAILRQVLLRHNDNSVESDYGWVMLYVYPVYAVLYFIFFMGYVVNFFLYARRANQSIVIQDTAMFNRSYKHLVLSMRMGIIVMLLNLVIWAIFFYIELGYYRQLQSL
ncbi:MAG TPA: hypothetical protein VD993_01600 [Chitinophagaceae bacterium]|nr:hypothetical protein [Chitinophagaceae bacterium]